MNKIVCIVGPTASGKSSLAVDVALKFSGEIISCDSMQLYKNMDIGTAKITAEEARGVPHHLTDVFDIDTVFSVSEYVKLAGKCVEDIESRGRVPVFCGGTGLYIDSFVSGLEFGEYENLPEYRAYLEEYAKENGEEALHEMLRKTDPEAAEKTDPHNVKRVIRALEVYKSSGEPISVWNKRAADSAVKKDALMIGLTFRDREKLYERINARVDIMVKNGLVEETERLIRSGLRETVTASQAIGYKELYPYIDGFASLEECVERLKINSRRYAKRQMTWFSRNGDIKWFYRDETDDELLKASVFRTVEEYLS